MRSLYPIILGTPCKDRRPGPRGSAGFSRGPDSLSTGRMTWMSGRGRRPKCPGGHEFVELTTPRPSPCCLYCGTPASLKLGSVYQQNTRTVARAVLRTWRETARDTAGAPETVTTVMKAGRAPAGSASSHAWGQVCGAIQPPGCSVTRRNKFLAHCTVDGPGNVRLGAGSQSHRPCGPTEVRTSRTANPERDSGCWG